MTNPCAGAQRDRCKTKDGCVKCMNSHIVDWQTAIKEWKAKLPSFRGNDESRRRRRRV